jgi:succinate dehydrogenase hydrophobic anchor subunit
MPTAADVELQQAREHVYDARWIRHRDQALVLLACVVVLVLVLAALFAGGVMIAGAAVGSPAWVLGTVGVLRVLPRGATSQDDGRDARPG